MSINDLHLSDIVEAVIARERSRAQDTGERATRAEASWSRSRRARGDDDGPARRPAISWSELMADIGRAPSGSL